MSEIKKIVAASFAASLVLATVLIIKTGYASVAGENTGIKTVLPSVIRDTFENVPESDKDADIDISYGYGNSARTGRYLPVHINYRVKSDHFKGRVSIKTKAPNGDVYEYNYPLEFENEYEKTYYVPIGYDIDRIFVSLYDDGEQVIIKKEIELDTSSGSDNLLIGILSDNPEKLSYFDSVFINYGVISTKSVVLDQYDFPEDSAGLSQLDMIVISDFRIRDLNNMQSMALMDWIKKGGIMLLGTGSRANDTLGRYAPELLDDMYEASRLTEVDLGEGLGIDEPGGGSIETECVSFQLHGGSELIPGDEGPLLSAVNKENGVIAVASYDFADEAVSDYANKHTSYISGLLSKILGNARMEALEGGVYLQDYGLYSDIQSIINNERADKIPNIYLFMFLIILYIIIIGPGIFLFLKKRNLQTLYIRVVGIISVCFAIIIYMCSIRTRFRGVFYNYASILDVDEDSVSEQTYVNFRNPYNKDYTVDISKQYSVRTISGEDFNFKSSKPFSENDSVDVGLGFYDDKTRIDVYSPGAFYSQFFKLERTYLNDDLIGFSGEINLFKDELYGYVTNNYNEKIYSAAVILYGKLVLLGDMEPGQTIALDDLKVYNIPLTNLKTVSRLITGAENFPEIQNSTQSIASYKESTPAKDDSVDKDTSEYKKTDRFYMDAIGKAGLIEFYMYFHQSGYSPDAKVIGFSRNKPDNDIIIGKEVENLGISLLVSRLTTDNKKDNLVYRQVLIKTPTVLGGIFFANTNAFYPLEPLVLEYQLGDDLDIKEINFENISPEFLKLDNNIEVFEGDIYFYNYLKASYDKKEMRTYSIDELNDYLSPPKAMRIRYVYRDKNSDSSISLPMISVIGSDKENEGEK